jgi:ketol-acid reductoisomerase
VLQKIRSGQFAREFIREMKTPRACYVQLLRDAENIPLKKWARDCAEWWLGAQKCKSTSALPRQQRACYRRTSEFWLLPRTVA